MEGIDWWSWFVGFLSGAVFIVILVGGVSAWLDFVSETLGPDKEE